MTTTNTTSDIIPLPPPLHRAPPSPLTASQPATSSTSQTTGTTMDPPTLTTTGTGRRHIERRFTRQCDICKTYHSSFSCPILVARNSFQVVDFGTQTEYIRILEPLLLLPPLTDADPGPADPPSITDDNPDSTPEPDPEIPPTPEADTPHSPPPDI